MIRLSHHDRRNDSAVLREIFFRRYAMIDTIHHDLNLTFFTPVVSLVYAFANRVVTVHRR